MKPCMIMLVLWISFMDLALTTKRTHEDLSTVFYLKDFGYDVTRYNTPNGCKWPSISDIEDGSGEQVLGVPQGPNPDQIRGMYDHLTDAFRPDKNKGKDPVLLNKAAELLKKVQDAYKKIIENPDRIFYLKDFGYDVTRYSTPDGCKWPSISDIEDGSGEQVLGVPQGPNPDQIRRMYDHLTDAFRPDNNNFKDPVLLNKAAELLKKVQDAYKKIVENPDGVIFSLEDFGCNVTRNNTPNGCKWPRISDIEDGSDEEVLGVPKDPKRNQLYGMYSALKAAFSPDNNKNKDLIFQKKAAVLLERVEEAFKNIIESPNGTFWLEELGYDVDDFYIPQGCKFPRISEIENGSSSEQVLGVPIGFTKDQIDTMYNLLKNTFELAQHKGGKENIQKRAAELLEKAKSAYQQLGGDLDKEEGLSEGEKIETITTESPLRFGASIEIAGGDEEIDLWSIPPKDLEYIDFKDDIEPQLKDYQIKLFVPEKDISFDEYYKAVENDPDINNLLFKYLFPDIVASKKFLFRVLGINSLEDKDAFEKVFLAGNRWHLTDYGGRRLDFSKRIANEADLQGFSRPVQEKLELIGKVLAAPREKSRDDIMTIESAGTEVRIVDQPERKALEKQDREIQFSKARKGILIWYPHEKIDCWSIPIKVHGSLPIDPRRKQDRNKDYLSTHYGDFQDVMDRKGKQLATFDNVPTIEVFWERLEGKGEEEKSKALYEYVFPRIVGSKKGLCQVVGVTEKDSKVFSEIFLDEIIWYKHKHQRRLEQIFTIINGRQHIKSYSELSEPVRLSLDLLVNLEFGNREFRYAQLLVKDKINRGPKVPVELDE